MELGARRLDGLQHAAVLLPCVQRSGHTTVALSLPYCKLQANYVPTCNRAPTSTLSPPTDTLFTCSASHPCSGLSHQRCCSSRSIRGRPRSLPSREDLPCRLSALQPAVYGTCHQ
jgi:hypothetical protein